MKNNNKLVTS